MDWSNVVIAIVSLGGTAVMTSVGFFIANAHADIKDIKASLADIVTKVTVGEVIATNSVTKEDLSKVIAATEKAITDVEKMYLELTFNVTGINTDNLARDTDFKLIQSDIVALKYAVRELKVKMDVK